MKILAWILRKKQPIPSGKDHEWDHEWGPLETLTDYWPVNGVHPIGHRCKVHNLCVLNVRLPDDAYGRNGFECRFEYIAPGSEYPTPGEPR